MFRDACTSRCGWLADGPKFEYGGGWMADAAAMGGRIRDRIVLTLWRKSTGLRSRAASR